MVLAEDSNTYKYQHLVPRTYLEAQDNQDNYLKVCKVNFDVTFYKKANELMGENNYYTISADCSDTNKLQYQGIVCE